MVAATGAFNWLQVKPVLDRPQGAKLLTRTATAELAVALLVLAVTAVLVATPTTMDEEVSRETILRGIKQPTFAETSMHIIRTHF